LPWFLACGIVRGYKENGLIGQVGHTGRVASFLLSVTSVGSGEGSFSRLVSRSSWLAMERSSSGLCISSHALGYVVREL
jgi:hypothetical protein